MYGINALPMKKVVKTVLDGLRDGTVLDYYLKERWEAPLRNDFAELAKAFASGNPTASDEGMEILRRLNYGYRTRYSLKGLYEFGDAIFDLMATRGWWEQKPPSLFGSSDAEALELSNLPAVIISGLAAKGFPRPYSLTTKCLHFLLPESFAICDQQSAASIQMWSYCSFDNRDEQWRLFSALHVRHEWHWLSWRDKLLPPVLGYSRRLAEGRFGRGRTRYQSDYRRPCNCY